MNEPTRIRDAFGFLPIRIIAPHHPKPARWLKLGMVGFWLGACVLALGLTFG